MDPNQISISPGTPAPPSPAENKEASTPRIDLSALESQNSAIPQNPNSSSIQSQSDSSLTPMEPVNPSEDSGKKSILEGNKGLLVAIAVGVVIIIVGSVALLNLGSGENVQGLIRQVEQQTTSLESK